MAEFRFPSGLERYHRGSGYCAWTRISHLKRSYFLDVPKSKAAHRLLRQYLSDLEMEPAGNLRDSETGQLIAERDEHRYNPYVNLRLHAVMDVILAWRKANHSSDCRPGHHTEELNLWDADFLIGSSRLGSEAEVRRLPTTTQQADAIEAARVMRSSSPQSRKVMRSSPPSFSALDCARVLALD